MIERFHIGAIDPSEHARVRDEVLAQLSRALPSWAEALEVGSTAVPGVIGKGDIDLLVRVPRERFDDARAIVDRLFERNPRQLSNEQYQGYLVPSHLDVAIQLTVRGGPYDDFVAFLDALRASPSLVERYNALKREWDGREMDAYREAKSRFITEALSRR
ncbi:GrpB family protein [Sandaracinus amylolyticus]|uniref:GrpB family protein n=1 Tax=Sandaracinus amylolyticus TaxID=927083 RepID=UPI001F1D1E55|nr:GrpB family protein [Sandaracinus amylolyticus]UJR84006.1 Hypothetical protein I5071_60770 [Sandaracinus amylolyticus]